MLKINKKLFLFYIIDIIIIVVSLLSAIYYNSAPGYGFMPGLTYLTEWLISSFFFIGSLALLVIVTIVILIKHFRKKKS